MSVFDNMAFGLTFERGYDKRDIRRRMEKAADMLQIRPCLDSLPRQLSGGQRQRVATRIEIARLHEEMDAVTMVYVTMTRSRP